MPLAKAEQAWIPREKLTAYLLNEAHPEGQTKARTLRQFGYGDDSVEVLKAHLLAIVRSGEVVSSRPTYSGINHVVIGVLPTPSGRPLSIRTVWFVGARDDRPRFVTAYPL